MNEIFNYECMLQFLNSSFSKYNAFLSIVIHSMMIYNINICHSFKDPLLFVGFSNDLGEDSSIEHFQSRHNKSHDLTPSYLTSSSLSYLIPLLT